MSTPLLEDDINISMTERHLFSLFARYPDIRFERHSQNVCLPPDSEWSQGQTDQTDSSPVSTLGNSAKRSSFSTSTARTTPLPQPAYPFRQQQYLNHRNSVASYLFHVRQADLPDECCLCFSSLAQSIGSISAALSPSTSGRYHINNTYFTDECSALLREARVLTSRTNEQIDRLVSLKTLLIFKVVPDDNNLWAIYRQRALHVVRLLALPSSAECRLITQLANLYSTILYTSAQALYDENEIEPTTMRTLNHLYDSFFTWDATYKSWCKDMHDFKNTYMVPLMSRVRASETVYQDIRSMHIARRKAENTLADPAAPRMLPITDGRVLEALNLSARRRETRSAMKQKLCNGNVRPRREKTI